MFGILSNDPHPAGRIYVIGVQLTWVGHTQLAYRLHIAKGGRFKKISTSRDMYPVLLIEVLEVCSWHPEKCHDVWTVSGALKP